MSFMYVADPILVDIVDDEWMRDSLPDDVIPLPEGLTDQTDDGDDVRDAVVSQNKGQEKWGELGLHAAS